MLQEAEESMLRDLFAAIDSKNAETFVDYLTPDALFRFGSAPVAEGRDAIKAAVGGFFESINGLQHQVKMAMRQGDTLVCEGDVTYTRHDGTTITLPFADVFEMDDGLIAGYKIYMDIGPLFAE